MTDPNDSKPLPALYHLGCGDVHLDGYVNVDVRETDATDRVVDLNVLDLGDAAPVRGFFSHAFFEHLRRDARVPHLRAAREALSEDGFVAYLGLPDFRRVAELYLERGPGIVGPTFDLYNAYRYTHGDPEAVDGWYLEQLHKSLFDVDEVEALLRDAGFPAYAVFTYVFPGEPVAVSLGFYALRRPAPPTRVESAARDFLRQFDGRFLVGASLAFVGGASRSELSARIAATPARRFVRRVALAAAIRLAR